MADEQDNKCVALVPYNKEQSLALRKKQELEEAIKRGEVRDPASLAGIAILIAANYAAAAISRAFQPKPPPQERGRTTGELVINAELGALIAEVYGGDPGDGIGGVWLPWNILWTIEKIRKHENISRQEPGGGKGFGGGSQSQPVIELTYDMDWAGLVGRGPLRSLKSKANNEVIYDLYGSVSNYEGESGSNTFSTPYSIESYQSASQGKEVTLQGSGAATSAVQVNTLRSFGAKTRPLTIYFRSSTGVSTPIAWSANGAAEVNITLPPSTSDQSYSGYTIQVPLNDGLNTFKIRNRSTTFNLGIDKIYCFPGRLTGGTGVFDPEVPADPPYDPNEPLDPIPPYNVPDLRFGAAPDTDEYDVQTATYANGGQTAFYSGNDTQLPDPVIQAVIDAKFGADSTPAYRGRAYRRDSGFFLTKYNNAPPNRTELVEHAFLKTMAQISAHLHDRVNILSSDYNFAAIVGILPRGIKIAGQRFEAKAPLERAARLFNYYYCESDGVITARLQGSVTNPAITEDVLGWTESEETDEPFIALASSDPKPTSIPSRVEIKYHELDRDGEAGHEGYGRQVTNGVEPELIEASSGIAFTFLRDEAKTICQREAYNIQVRAKKYSFTVTWEYLWWEVGSIQPVTLDDGSSHQIQITKITGGIGVLEVEGEAVDVPLMTQSAVADPNPFELPVVPIVSMTMLALLDIPARDGDATFNNGVLQYAGGTPRTSTRQIWTGFALYVDKGLGDELLENFTLPATIGVIHAVSNITETTTDFDRTGQIIIDFYETDSWKPTLESVPEAMVRAGANLACVNTPNGEILLHFANAVRVDDGSPNRWAISTLLHGIKGTGNAVGSYVAGRRFVLINSAIKPIAMNLADLNVPLDYTAVSHGQSLDDAARLENVIWTGRSRQNPAPTRLKSTRDSGSDILAEFEGQARVGGGERSYQGGAINEEAEEYRMQIMDGSSVILPNGRERIIPIITTMPMAALLESNATTKFGGIKHNKVEIASGAPFGSELNARSFQQIMQTGNRISATLTNNSSGVAAIGIIPASANWKSAESADVPLFIYLAGGHLLSRSLSILEYNVSKIFIEDSETTPVLPGVRVEITFSGTEIRVKCFLPTVNEPVTYRASFQPSFPYHVFATVAVAGSKVDQIMMTTWPFPKTIYSSDQQRDDFQLDELDPLPESINVRIWQHSPLTGPGQILEGVL